MKFAYTIFYVQEVEATLDFYQRAFGFEQKFITPEKDYGELISGAVSIAFASITLGKSNFKEGFQQSKLDQVPFGIEIALTSEDIETDFARALQAGAVEVVPVEQKPWGQKVGYVRDNNGFLVEICTPMNS